MFNQCTLNSYAPNWEAETHSNNMSKHKTICQTHKGKNFRSESQWATMLVLWPGNMQSWRLLRNAQKIFQRPLTELEEHLTSRVDGPLFSMVPALHSMLAESPWSFLKSCSVSWCSKPLGLRIINSLTLPFDNNLVEHDWSTDIWPLPNHNTNLAAYQRSDDFLSFFWKFWVTKIPTFLFSSWCTWISKRSEGHPPTNMFSLDRRHNNNLVVLVKLHSCEQNAMFHDLHVVTESSTTELITQKRNEFDCSKLCLVETTFFSRSPRNALMFWQVPQLTVVQSCLSRNWSQKRPRWSLCLLLLLLDFRKLKCLMQHNSHLDQCSLVRRIKRIDSSTREADEQCWSLPKEGVMQNLFCTMVQAHQDQRNRTTEHWLQEHMNKTRSNWMPLWRSAQHECWWESTLLWCQQMQFDFLCLFGKPADWKAKRQSSDLSHLLSPSCTRKRRMVCVQTLDLLDHRSSKLAAFIL